MISSSHDVPSSPGISSSHCMAPSYHTSARHDISYLTIWHQITNAIKSRHLIISLHAILSCHVWHEMLSTIQHFSTLATRCKPQRFSTEFPRAPVPQRQEWPRRFASTSHRLQDSQTGRATLVRCQPLERTCYSIGHRYALVMAEVGANYGGGT